MAFALLVIYIVILLVRPQEWYEPLRGLRLVDVTAILTLVATLITRPMGDSPVSLLRSNRYGRLMWGLLGAVLLSDLSRMRMSYALYALEDFGKLCVLFFLTMILVDRVERIRTILWVIVGSALLLTVHAWMQVKTGQGFGGIEAYSPETISGQLFDPSWITGTDFRVRGSGSFNDPNDFAMLYIMATPFVVALIQAPTIMPAKLLLVCALPAYAFVLYFTKSRGGLAGFCVMVLAYMWMANRRNFIRLLLTVILVGAAVAFGPARTKESLYEGSAGGRIVAWGVGNGFLKQNPLFGLGYNRWFDMEKLAAHSSFVTCYAELGLVGYFFWFSLAFLVARGLLRITRMRDILDPMTTRLAGGLFAGLVGYLACGFFLTRTYHPVLYLLLGLGIGMIRNAQRNPNVPPGALDIARRDLIRAGLMALLSIPAIWLVIKAYWAAGSGGQ